MNTYSEMVEQDLLDAILELAAYQGWMAFHPRPARYQSGRWATHYQGDRGFPDIVLAHPERGVIFAELKTVKGRATPHQAAWLYTLELAGQEAAIWTPNDWKAIVKRLGGTPNDNKKPTAG